MLGLLRSGSRVRSDSYLRRASRETARWYGRLTSHGAERVSLYREQSALFQSQLERCTTMIGEVAIMDLRRVDPVYAGNRFMVYAVNPEASVSVHVLWGRQKQNTVLAVAKSVLNRSNHVDIGALVLGYGVGGHPNAGTCQVAHDDAERSLGEIVATLNGADVATAA